MLQLYKRMQRMRENYVDTIAKLYEYATTAYAKNQYTQWYDTKGTWDAVHAQAKELDDLVNEFNEATGLLKAL
mgnify:CR=1 FL=1